MDRHLSRRDALASLLAATGLMAEAARSGAHAQAELLAPTPACGPQGPAGSTPRQTEGPFYTPNAPGKRSLRGDDPGGRPVTLVGYVLDRRCRPQAGAVVDLWQADTRGAYDLVGTRLRGRQTVDEAGRYLFETVLPGRYEGRTRHFHVKLAAPGTRPLTTQLYLPGEAGNRGDGLFDSRLLVKVATVAGSSVARFDFVLDAA